MYHPSMKAKMDTLEEERARLEAKLLAIPEPEPVVLHPGLAGIYAGKVSKLAEALNEDGTWAEADDLLRGLIEKVIGRSRPKADGQLKGSSPPFCPNFG
jgi:site-specific DNA recombinase